jgi:Family of unknown function (DUF6186)
VLSSRTRSRLTAAVGTACAVAAALAVGLGGELSPAAHVAVLGAGTVVVGVGLVRRVGDGSPPADRTARIWVVLLVLAFAAEAVALADDGVPTASDLLDPVLAPFATRTAATLGWLAAGARLATRPGPTLGAAMRAPAGRVAVLSAWLWLGLHFLAR